MNTLSKVEITANEVIVNGLCILKKVNDNIHFFDTIYEHLSIAYPKFYKMDAPSQLCFLAAEFLLKDLDISQYPPYEKSIFIETKEGCLLSDIDFSASQKTTPSPGTFVYTLPNVMIGEISIRHKFKGESYCMITNEFSAENQQKTILSLLSAESKICLHGWINVSKNAYNAILWLSTF